MPIDQDLKNEVEQLKNSDNRTKRAISTPLENVLYDIFPVLDHGFLRVIDYMGNDSSIVQAARVSYGRGTKQMNEDKGLINYLLRNAHTTPFEMCEIKFHVKLPIFIARQWIRHRTANVNEYSARYSILDKEFYLPNIEDICSQSLSNKQCREDQSLSRRDAMQVLQILQDDAERCYKHYIELLGEGFDAEATLKTESIRANVKDIEFESEVGIARELARMNLTLNYYTQWYWKIDLHNLLHFIKLRAHSHAQLEIRKYAETMLEVVKLWVPITYEAFSKYTINSRSFSVDEIEIVQKMLKGEDYENIKSRMSKREWSSLCQTLGIKR